VAGQEGNTPPGDLTKHNGIARRAERGLDSDLVASFQQCVEPRTADDPDGGFVRHGAQATFVPVEEDFLEPDDVLPGFDSPEDDELDEVVFWSAPADFSLDEPDEEESPEEPFSALSLAPLEEETRLSLR